MRLFLGLVFIFAAQAQAADLGEVIKDPRGYVLSMTLGEAQQLCQSRGTRLPTAREFAGATDGVSIRESQYPRWMWNARMVLEESSQESRSGHEIIYRSDYYGDVYIDFYSDNDRYHTPSSRDLKNRFWTDSKSLCPACGGSPSQSVAHLAFDGGDGRFYHDYPDETQAVRCVK